MEETKNTSNVQLEMSSSSLSSNNYLWPPYEPPKMVNKLGRKKIPRVIQEGEPQEKRQYKSAWKPVGYGKVGRPKKGTKKPKTKPTSLPLRKLKMKKFEKQAKMTRSFIKALQSGEATLNPTDDVLMFDESESFEKYESAPFVSSSSTSSNESVPQLSTQFYESDKTISDADTIESLQEQLAAMKLVVGNFRCHVHTEWHSYVNGLPKKKREGPEFNFQEEWIEFQHLYNQNNQPTSRVNKAGFRPVFYLTEVMEFKPTLDQMKDFEKFISFMIWMGADIAGGAIIKTPDGYSPRKSGYNSWTHTFNNAHVQNVEGVRRQETQYVSFAPEKRSYSVQELFVLDMMSPTPPNDEVDKEFWDFMHLRKPVYCKDEIGTLFDDDQFIFNLDKLNTLLTKHGNWLEEKEAGLDAGLPGAGLIRSYLYLSCFGTLFSDHIEDFSFFSANYLHFGHCKRWRFIPPSYGFKYLSVLKKLRALHFKEEDACDWFVLHKELMVSNKECDDHSIPYSQVDQHPGDFIITFPFSFHSGYNTGFNCAEAVNFVTGPNYWPLYGLFTPRCGTGTEEVKCPYGDVSSFDIGPILKKCMPEVYTKWKSEAGYRGKHPQALPFSADITVKRGEVLAIPDYICEDPKKESLKDSYIFRRFYKDEKDLKEIKKIKIHRKLATFILQHKTKTL